MLQIVSVNQNCSRKCLLIIIFFHITLKGMNSRAERDKQFNEAFKKFLKVINATFDDYDIQLRFETIYDEEKKRRVGGLALVNRTDCSAEESKMTIKSQICYSLAEVEYLKIILR